MLFHTDWSKFEPYPYLKDPIIYYLSHMYHVYKNCYFTGLIPCTNEQVKIWWEMDKIKIKKSANSPFPGKWNIGDKVSCPTQKQCKCMTGQVSIKL